MMSTIASSTLAVLLALLLTSAVWAARKPAWQIVFGPPETAANRIALTEFYAEARDEGWDFPADRQLCLDLAIGLRDAGFEGSIEIWGRKCQALAVAAAPPHPLLRIPAAFWKHHEIDGLRMAIAPDAGGAHAAGMETNNLLIRTQAVATSDPEFDDTIYQDIHLNYIQAMDWLQTDAGHYRGISRKHPS